MATKEGAITVKTKTTVNYVFFPKSTLGKLKICLLVGFTVLRKLSFVQCTVTAKMVLAKFGPWTKFCKQILVPDQILPSTFGPPG